MIRKLLCWLGFKIKWCPRDKDFFKANNYRCKWCNYYTCELWKRLNDTQNNLRITDE